MKNSMTERERRAKQRRVRRQKATAHKRPWNVKGQQA